QAQLSYNNATINSNIAVGEILEILSADKIAVTTTYNAGGDVTYVISAVNSGTTPVGGISVTDNLGAYPFGEETLYPLTYKDGSVRLYINGVLQAAPTTVAGPPLVISGITLPANSNIVLVYEATVNSFAPLGEGDSVVNTATVTGNGIATPITATETVTPATEAMLDITKSISPVPVAENGVVTYTFVIRNSGNTPADATANVTLTDTFLPILSDLTVLLNGVALAEGTGYTYSITEGDFATVPGVITVPAATYTQDPVSGVWSVSPGTATLTVTGTV
ncbi:MAG: hypothetical protein J6Q70_01635, partial [Clostridia bacterium]|nr:hypothetical protein [Clostridia bacterium]